MRIQWKHFTGFDNMERANIPPNAVKIGGDMNFRSINLMMIPVIGLLALLLIVVSSKHYYDSGIFENDMNNVLRIFIVIVCAAMGFIAHEYLHAVLFPQRADVVVYNALDKGLLFCYSTYPISKLRHIVILVTPSLILGIIPFIIWLLFPARTGYITACSNAFFMIMILAGAGDYISAIISLFALPRGSYIQMDGKSNYYYIPEYENNEHYH